jgi:hypothetical protein
MSSYMPGDTVSIPFTITAGGGLVDADSSSLIGSMIRNAAVDPAVTNITYTNLGIGEYVCTAPIPSTYTLGVDDVAVQTNCTVGGTPIAVFFSLGRLDRRVVVISSGIYVNVQGGTGAGLWPVNHNSGGANALQITTGPTSSPTGVAGALITAYLATDFANSQLTSLAKGQTSTTTSGQWVAPLMLNTGSYVLVISGGNPAFQSNQNIGINIDVNGNVTYTGPVIA